MRVITHSSGAFVVAATMGNPAVANPLQWPAEVSLGQGVGKPECQPTYKRLCGYAADRTHPQYGVPKTDDFRVLMLAPATVAAAFAPTTGVRRPVLRKSLFTPRRGALIASERVFSVDFTSHGVMMKDATLIIGMNREDEVIKKFVGLVPLFGSTALGRFPHFYQDYLQVGAHCIRGDARAPRNLQTYFFDFSGTTPDSCGTWFGERHDLACYLQSSDIDPALDILFAAGTTDEAEPSCSANTRECDTACGQYDTGWRKQDAG